MNKTSIEWVKNPDGTQGYTWNPITGCPNGCPYCYARKLAMGRLKSIYRANKNTAPQISTAHFKLFPEHPFYPRFWPERLSRISQGTPSTSFEPKGIFVCDMGELFGDWVPNKWQEEVFQVIRGCKWHRFYLLTKQPQNLLKFSPFPENCWVGVTATNTELFAQSLIKAQGIKAKVKYISFEPLLSWGWNNIYHEPLELVLKAEGINQVIIGAQTKPYKPPKIEGVEEIVKACDKAGVKVFLKNNLEPLWTLENSREPFFRFSRPSPGATAIGKLRQEMPE